MSQQHLCVSPSYTHVFLLLVSYKSNNTLRLVSTHNSHHTKLAISIKGTQQSVCDQKCNINLTRVSFEFYRTISCLFPLHEGVMDHKEIKVKEPEQRGKTGRSKKEKPKEETGETSGEQLEAQIN